MKAKFEGWYFKQQTKDNALALIPGIAEDGAFIHVVTRDAGYSIPFQKSAYQKGNGEDFIVSIGDNHFSKEGMTIDINTPDLQVKGELKFGQFTPIKGDIMGPFQYFPMECRHLVLSMNHWVRGQISVNGQLIDFDGGVGYIEGDSGTSFPKKYAWIHANGFENSDVSVMLAIAKIPFYGLRFWGTICVVSLDGKEYRFATYKGVKILKVDPKKLEIKQGRYRLTVEIDEHDGVELPAPKFGNMGHKIKESLTCKATFRLMEKDVVLFEGSTNQASFEYEM